MKKTNFKAKNAILFMIMISLPFSVNAQTFRDRILPTEENSGFNMSDYWVWCGAVIKGEDGKYHMFASRWPKSIGFNHWRELPELLDNIESGLC